MVDSPRFHPAAGRAAVMAILNVTPDSFSDGGQHQTAAAAIYAGIRFADLGAALVDIGGESTRPRGATYGLGAREVSIAEELGRVLPVVEGLRTERPDIAISVDTRKLPVAAAALEAGADVVNLVTGLDADTEMLALVRDHRAAIVLNHCRGTPETTFDVSRFDDVVTEVADDLERARQRALAAGLPAGSVLVDPGLGFGKTAEQNVALVRGLARLAPEGVGLVVGASRKAFLALGGRPPTDRLPESLAAVAAAATSLVAASGPLLVRVHDVEETVRFLTVLETLRPE